jgi:uncharacterized damage-inducible protein DinB
MQIAEISTLFHYNDWANQKILDATARLAPEAYAAPAGLSHGSIRGMLLHCLSAEMQWRQRCQSGTTLKTMLSENELPAFAQLRRRWEEETRARRAYLDGLSDADLGREVHYVTLKGVPYKTPLWQIWLHLVNHGTQCRSEAGVALTAWGCSPGDIDLIYYLRDLGHQETDLH